MGQTSCLPAAAFLGYRRLPAHTACTNGSSGSNSSNGRIVSALPDALEVFRARGLKALTGPKEVLWGAACTLIEALLLGAMEHIRELQVESEVHEGSVGEASEEVLSMRVHLSPAPIYGEVATPSRFPHEIRLLSEMRFALQLPQSCTTHESVVLRVSGLHLAKLPGIEHIRERMKRALGDAYGRDTAFAWWQKHKEEEFPLGSWKFRRIYESLFGTAPLPVGLRKDFLWGFLQSYDCYIQAFIFSHGSGSSGIRIAAERAPSRLAEDVEYEAIGAKFAREQLRQNRTSGEQFAASATHYAAMVYGPSMGQPAASAKLITKLFSAAEWWGPGTSGWQQCDQTWLCRDKKNFIGKIVVEQGRTIWRVEADGSPQTRPCSPASPQPPGPPWFQRLRLMCACCKRRPQPDSKG